MYSVTAEAEAAWQGLLAHVLDDAGLGGLAGDYAYLPWPAPKPLEDLWRRPDLGCAFMCGYPIALGLADVTPIAAPLIDAPWTQGAPVYRSDLIVRADSPWTTLEETFGGRVGWTVDHSHSGFNALRRHLLPHLLPGRRTVYAGVTGNLVTARAILDAVKDGRIDIGPLDAYWHLLLRAYRPDLVEGVRTLVSTDLAPAPAFVAGPDMPAEHVARLGAAFEAASSRVWFPDFAHKLKIVGFSRVTRVTYAPMLQWRDEALAAGYPEPR
jgi:ABC-type phosphate/phosphonate transport system substrate-binding protein